MLVDFKSLSEINAERISKKCWPSIEFEVVFCKGKQTPELSDCKTIKYKVIDVSELNVVVKRKKFIKDNV